MTMETKNKPKISEILQRLIEARKITPNELARQTGLPHNTIYMILGDKVNVPNGATLIAFANFFGISVDYLLGRVSVDKEEPYCNQKLERNMKLIPIIQWSDINDWINHRETLWRIEERRWIEYLDKESERAFALEIKKKYLEHLFPQNSVIIVNPQGKMHDGDYIVVQDGNEVINLWQIKNFNSKQYIRPIGIKDDALELKKPFTVLGKIVESRQYYI